MQSLYSSTSPDSQMISEPKSQQLYEMEELKRNEFLGEKYNLIFDQRMKECKHVLLRNLGDSNIDVLNREFQAAGQRIKMQVAHEIFNDVNRGFDLVQHIDLSCLDSTDARIIACDRINNLA